MYVFLCRVVLEGDGNSIVYLVCCDDDTERDLFVFLCTLVRTHRQMIIDDCTVKEAVFSVGSEDFVAKSWRVRFIHEAHVFAIRIS